MMMGLMLFDRSFLDIVTITFSALIVIELLNIFTELHKISTGMIISVSLSMLVYFLTLVLFHGIIDVSRVDALFFLKIFVVAVISWAPIYLLKFAEKRIWPSDYDIIMKERGNKICCR